MRACRDSRHWLLGIVLCMIGSCVALVGCDVKDDRDECCGGAIIRFRYRELGEDKFNSDIHSMRHFLFTDDDKFFKEVPSNSADMQNLVIANIEDGDYKLVTIANSTEAKAWIDKMKPFRSTIHDLKMGVFGTRAEGDLKNTDELYWNEGSFHVVPDTLEVVYTGDLSNIHCHMTIRVFWHTLPKLDGLYTMRLSGVPTSYSLDPYRVRMRMTYKNYVPDDFYEKDVSVSFPDYEPGLGTHTLNTYLFNLELKGEFVTLRYTYDDIPVFQLFHGDKAITKEIDLKRAFRAWNWNPDESVEQNYRIQMEIFDDGKVVVNQWLDSEVTDWQDGGKIMN